MFYYNLTLTWMFSMLQKKNVDQWNNAMTSGCTCLIEKEKKSMNSLLFSKEDIYEVHTYGFTQE